MITVRTNRGVTYRGTCPQTIARRLYGSQASVRLGSTLNADINGYVEAIVTKPAPKSGDNASSIEATWLLDDRALTALEQRELVEEEGRP